MSEPTLLRQFISRSADQLPQLPANTPRLSELRPGTTGATTGASGGGAFEVRCVERKWR